MAGIFSTLSIARSALLAQSAAIRTVGQNIANAGTEGYSRQRVHLAQARPERLGDLSVGTGVQIERIERIVDQHLEESLRNAGTALEDLKAKSTVLSQIESTFNELEETGVGPALERFFEAVNQWSLRPEDMTLRRQVVAAAGALADAFHYAAGRLREIRSAVNDEVEVSADTTDQLTAEIAQLNGEIVAAENGGRDLGTANDLRDRRDLLLRRLAELVDLKAVETSTGAVNVMVQGQYLVYGKHATALTRETTAEDGVLLTVVRIGQNGPVLSPESGRLAALLQARDEIVPRFREDLDMLAHTVVEQFNRIHSTGEGLRRFTDLTSTRSVSSPTVALSELSLPFSVSDGRFTFTVKNENTGAIDYYDIAVDLTGSQQGTTLQALADAITNAAGAEHSEISATVTGDLRLRISSSDPSLTFGFADDTTGVLGALGLNTLFTGESAADIAVNDLLEGDLSYLAASRGGGPGDNSAALAMLELRTQPLIEGATMTDWWQSKLGQLGVEKAQAEDLASNQERILTHLTNQREALSGVNIDEEAMNLIVYQRAFQGAARLLAVVDSLVATLLQAV